MNALYSTSKRVKNFCEVADDIDLPEADFDEALAILNADIISSGEENIRARVYMQNQIEALDGEIKRLQGAKKHYQNRLARFDNSTMAAMAMIDRKEIKTNLGRLVRSKGKGSLQGTENNPNIPAEFLDVKQVITVRKNDLKEAIKNGLQVDGCYIEYNDSLQVK